MIHNVSGVRRHIVECAVRISLDVLIFWIPFSPGDVVWSLFGERDLVRVRCVPRVVVVAVAAKRGTPCVLRISITESAGHSKH